MFAFACHESIFGILRNLCSKIFACHERIFEILFTLCSDICIFHVRKNISDISLFGFRRLYLLFLFPFLYKTKKIVFVKFFRNFRILRILCFFRNFRILRILCFFRNFRILRILCFFSEFQNFENFMLFFGISEF